MKINFWKFMTLLFAIVIVCLFTLTSFKNNPERATSTVGDSPVLTSRAEVRQLYDNFARQYPTDNFAEKGGSISKSTLQAILSTMTNKDDGTVYYYFGRTNEGKNVIMLLNDPTYHDLDKTNKYVAVAPFCPPNCNMVLNDYVTSDK